MKRYEYEVRVLPGGEVIASRDEELPARVYLGATWVDELEVVDIERKTEGDGNEVVQKAVVYVQRPKQSRARTRGQSDSERLPPRLTLSLEGEGFRIGAAGQATGGMRN